MRLRTVIFIIAFLVGVVPILTLVAVNLADHIRRHDQVDMRALRERAALRAQILAVQPPLSAMKNDAENIADVLCAMARRVTGDQSGMFLLRSDGTVVLSCGGEKDPVHMMRREQAGVLFTRHREKLSTALPLVLTADARTAMEFLPLPFTPSGRSPIWLVSMIDRSGAHNWKLSLIRNILVIMSATMLVVYVAALVVSRHADRIRTDILQVIKGIIEEKKPVPLQWQGPKELRLLAEQLNRMAREYIQARHLRRVAETDLEESDAKLRHLTSSAKDAIIMLTPDGAVSFWNRAAGLLFGFSEQEALGKPVYALIAPRLPKKERQLWRQQGENSGPVSETIELVAHNRDGTAIPIELSISEALIQKKWHSIWIIRDISERIANERQQQEQQQQLVQADRMISLGLLVAGVAHEINNPNSITLINTPLLRRAWHSIEPILAEHYAAQGEFTIAGLPYTDMRREMPHLFDALEESGRRIKGIVQELKDYARQELPGKVEQVDIGEVVATAVRLVKNRIDKGVDRFVFTPGPAGVFVTGTTQRLEQVVVNLLLNAVEAMTHEKARAKTLAVSIHMNRENQTLSVMVHDSGCGMTSEQLAHCRDPFFTTKRNEGGTGLGLAVSAAIIKEHGGELLFVSEPGKGTVAEMRLPYVGAHDR